MYKLHSLGITCRNKILKQRVCNKYIKLIVQRCLQSINIKYVSCSMLIRQYQQEILNWYIYLYVNCIYGDVSFGAAVVVRSFKVGVRERDAKCGMWFCTSKKVLRHMQDSNLRRRSLVDFESTSLTTRTICRAATPKIIL